MYIGVDIGGTKCAVVCGERPDKIAEKVAFKTEGIKKTLDRISEIIEGIGSACSIGISCGGPLDEKRGIIMSPPNLPGWDDIHITELLKSRFGVPVGIRNDANACALAEHRYGAGRGTENMVFLTFGTGLGAGIIIGGKLYGGTNGMAGEVGHIRLSKDGPVGYGKRGSFEGFCSGGGIAQLGKALAVKAINEGNPPAFCASLSDMDSITAKKIAECAAEGDATALEGYDYKLKTDLTWELYEMPIIIDT